jgi:hypothetical protein
MRIAKRNTRQELGGYQILKIYPDNSGAKNTLADLNLLNQEKSKKSHSGAFATDT